MATTTPDEPSSLPQQIDEAVPARLAALERQVADGNREARRVGNSFAVFAVAALLLSMATLAAVIAEGNSESIVSANGSGHAGGPMTGAGTTTLPHTTPAPRIAVSLAEYSVGLSRSVGRTGVVTFAVRNAGTVPHEFVVLRTSKPAAELLKGNRADETGNVGETGDMQPGTAKTLRLRLKPGHYALICNLPGHYMAGQHADFTVR
jgi:uncharacterized cupredoxin-like copper-binding protein